MPGDTNWAEQIRRIEQGDRGALISLARRVSVKLRRVRAADFGEDLDDLVQQVIVDTIMAVRRAGVTDETTVGALISRIADRRFQDRLRLFYRVKEDKKIPWEESLAVDVLRGSPGDWAARVDLRTALCRIDAENRAAITEVYLNGWTYPEAAERLGVPLGVLKYRLKEGLKSLRQSLSAG